MLQLPKSEREALWHLVISAIERYQDGVAGYPVAPVLDPGTIRAGLATVDFDRPLAPAEALEFVVRGLTEHQVHTPHPRYFGLFNPAPTTLGIAADAIVAAWNPQLAAWSHSPYAVEVEAHVLRALGSKLGLDPETLEGCFASGGAEANHTAVLTALIAAHPAARVEGIRGLSGPLALYVSAEAHHSFAKAARLSGLGTDAVRTIPVDRTLRMIPDALRERILADRAKGALPFLVVGTAGTTGAGVVDPLPELAEICREFQLWFHVDAAWGGAAMLVPALRSVLAGLERADSVTVDAHKLLSVPMGAGMFLTRHPGILRETFAIDAGYMPREAAGLPIRDPYATSMQWSRRFIGLKLFLSLLVAGWDGYAQAIGRQAEMGDLLRERLRASDWVVMNETPLPVVCFQDARRPGEAGSARLSAILGRVLASGDAWISRVDLPHHGPALRASITHFGTGPEDLEGLIRALERARKEVEDHA